MSRVAFITDQHFEASSRWDETLRVAQWCANTLRELGPDVIALGGDMFEKRPTPLEVKAVAEWLVQLGDVAPIVGVTGNHDVPDSLAPMNLLEARYPISIADTPQNLFAGGVHFSLLPWPRKAHLLAALGEGVGREEAGAAATLALQSVLRGLAAPDLDCPRCFVGHVQLAGARVSTGQPLAPGADFELGLGDLAMVQAQAYLLGHIHLPQNSGDIEGAPVLYGGSFRRTSFGELEEKSIVVVDFSTTPASVERIPIPCRKMLHFTSRFEPSVSRLVIPADMPADEPPCIVAGAEIRYRYETPRDYREVAREQALQHVESMKARGAYSVRLEEIVLTETRARSPEVAAAKTLPDRLDAFWASKGIDVGRRRDSIMSKLSSLEEEARNAEA